MDKTSVKKNLRKAREESKYTQGRLAEALGISRTAYRNLENGKTNPFNKHISHMAEIIGKAPEELVLGYPPQEISGSILKDIEKYKEKISLLEQQLKEKDGVIEAQKKTIASQEQTIRSKEQVISMLERQK